MTFLCYKAIQLSVLHFTWSGVATARAETSQQEWGQYSHQERSTAWFWWWWRHILQPVVPGPPAAWIVWSHSSAASPALQPPLVAVQQSTTGLPAL